MTDNLFVEAGNYCGHCGTRLPDLLHDCHFETGGGRGLDLLAGNVNLVGSDGAGVSVVDADGTLIHLCGEPWAGNNEGWTRVKMVTDRHYDVWVGDPDGHRHLRGNRPVSRDAP